MFVQPIRWTEEKLSHDADISRQSFVSNRLQEGAAPYLEAFDSHKEEVNRLLLESENLLQLVERAAKLLASGALGVVRYLSAPAISEDDLKTLTGVASVSTAALGDRSNASQIMRVVSLTIDVRRFPWVVERRQPSAEERRVAIVSTAALMASQEVQTARRSASRDRQENAVAAYLADDLGYIVMSARAIERALDAPAPGQFCRESVVAGKKADIVIGLADGRFMALECKVSNSEVNSFKRLNHEVVDKIRTWRQAFGQNGVVGAALLAGVYKTANLVDAQDEGVSIFWSHELCTLGDFLRRTERRTR